jgi:chemotaxis protein CheX
MNSELEKILREVAEDMFASLAYLMPASEAAHVAADSGPRARVRVAFSGPFMGCLVLCVDLWMLPILAANMLGLMDADSTSREQQQDALKELLNVICGNLLPRIASPQEVFHVHAPFILPDGNTAEIPETRPLAARVTLWPDGGQADLALFTDYPLAVPAA